MDKAFKRFNRAELVELIYQLQLNNQQLTKENEELAAKLESKNLKMSKAGSIAEAVVDITEIFSKAQETADYYLAEIYRNNAEIEEQCTAKISDAQAKADSIIQQAEYIAKKKIEDAEKESAQIWQEVNEKIDQLVKSHEALKPFLTAVKENPYEST